MALSIGFAFMKMWAWFVVPALHLPSIGLLEAIGLASIVRLVTYQLNAANSRKGSLTKAAVEEVLSTVLRSTLFLVFGLIVRSFM
jgi:hypothetical protein